MTDVKVKHDRLVKLFWCYMI